MCRKVSPHDGRRCLGCGTPIANAKVTTKAPAKPRCPNCGSGKNKPVLGDESRLECQACHAAFELPDGYALDDRPDVNAEKRERMAGGRRLKQDKASADLWKGGRR
jgi:transposase-like protein